jgi:hypothetical protein
MKTKINITKAEYGAKNNFIDITSKFKELFLNDNCIKLLKGTNLNDLFTDPCFLNEKIIKINVLVNNKKVTFCDYESDNMLLNNIIINEETMNKYDDIYTVYMHNCKNEFRLFCLNYLSYIRGINLPKFCAKSNYESVLIEYRSFPHTEFLIRNNIIKLGEKWCHTVICGNLNYDYMVRICSMISNKIQVIKTNYDNLTPSEYSQLLSSLEFWKLLDGEKILIYQEDSIIFKNNINDFLKWDYIGAPWPKNNNDNVSRVGNGGLSLRTKSVMMEIINRIDIKNTKINSSTFEYTKLTHSNVIPEDVYFSKNMEDLKIGLLADVESASSFSTEAILNTESFGGHNFWLNDWNWKDRVLKNNIIQFKQNFNLSIIEHRGGWKSILKTLQTNNFYNDNSEYDFFDIIELKFMWNEDINFVCKNKWAGIIHCTHETPEFLNSSNIKNLFYNKCFIESLNNCKFIITFNNYITNFLKDKLVELNTNVAIYTLKHPVDTENIILFDYNNFISNNNKKLLQIGQQLRKMSSIYLLNVKNFEKIWLTGTRKFNKCEELLKKEIEFLKIDKKNLKDSVLMQYTNTFQEYDELLSKNIVFIDLFDAAANNTILECIIRNTPIIVNKLSPIIDYLGEDYPLYFNHLNEVPELLINEKILAAHNYLTKINKDELSIDLFAKKLMEIGYSHFSN